MTGGKARQQVRCIEPEVVGASNTEQLRLQVRIQEREVQLRWAVIPYRNPRWPDQRPHHFCQMHLHLLNATTTKVATSVPLASLAARHKILLRVKHIDGEVTRSGGGVRRDWA